MDMLSVLAFGAIPFVLLVAYVVSLRVQAKESDATGVVRAKPEYTLHDLAQTHEPQRQVVRAAPVLSEAQERALRREELREERAEEFDTYLRLLMEHGFSECFHARVAGVSHTNDDGVSRQALVKECKPYDNLALMRDPENAFSRYAVQVLNEFGEQLGFLPEETARQVARDMDAGGKWTGVVRERGKAHGGAWGLRIVLLRMSDERVARLREASASES